MSRLSDKLEISLSGAFSMRMLVDGLGHKVASRGRQVLHLRHLLVMMMMMMLLSIILCYRHLLVIGSSASA